MSRFVEVLNEFCAAEFASLSLDPLLRLTLDRLQASSAEAEVEFPYFMQKQAPISKESSLLTYSCRLRGRQDRAGEEGWLVLSIRIPISTVCPCSRAISEQGAHNQRAFVKADLRIRGNTDCPLGFVGEMISLIELSGSSPVYPLLKRPDEKFITEQQFGNPKFVEDVLRDAVVALRKHPQVEGFALEVEALESIHAHNAWASHQENMVN